MMDSEHWARRRRRVMEQVGENGVALLAAAPERVRNRDVLYPYRQDSDFTYLTGFPEPRALMVLMPGREDGEYILFCRDRDPERETWDGRRAGPEGAVDRYGADQAFSIDRLDELMPRLLANRERVFHTLGRQRWLDASLVRWMNGLRGQERVGLHAPGEIIDLDGLVHEMRLRKGDPELDCMRRAMDTSARAHVRAMRECRPGMTEYQLAAELHYEFNRDGMEPAYGSIVGSGANGCILHYVENADVMRDGDLVLIDAGAECQGYCADITRTFPVNGRFSDAQKAVYEVVLAAQLAAIEQVRPGNHYMRPHEAAVEVLTQGLVDLGMLSGEVAALVEDGAYRPYYMHGTGHWLGMDVHDVGAYKVGGDWRPLEPGMVVTVEPGLYLPAGLTGVDERFADIGIRIEDDVLVTESGCEVMTAATPKTVADVEAAMAG